MNFDKGTLKLTVNVNGKPAYAGVHVEEPLTHKWLYQASVFRTDTPVRINLPAGKVDLAVQAGGRDIPEQRVNGVEIVAGKTTGQIIPIEVKVVGASVADTKGMEQNTDRPGGGYLRVFSPATDDPAFCARKPARKPARTQHSARHGPM